MAEQSAMSWPFGHLRPLSYGAIIADPPWEQALWSPKGEGKAPQAHYGCMSLDAIKALPVGHLARGDCLLALWAISNMVPQALQVLEAWGFRFVTTGAWAKQSRTGQKWHFGTGYVLRGAMELFLIGALGSPELRSRSERNLIVAPAREHSRKPPALHDSLERLTAGPYCELFARETRPGWDCWGDQVSRFGEAS